MSDAAVAECPAVEESPCDTCPHYIKCRAGGSACAAFETFVHRGDPAWRQEPRVPSMLIYRKVFKRKKLAA